MKILCIASEIGYDAPGIVYEKLIKGLSIDNKVSIICPRISNTLFSESVNIHKCIKFKKTRQKLESLLFAFLGKNFFDIIWSYLSYRKLEKNVIKDQDAIISFVSGNNYISLLLANLIVRDYHIKWISYLVDAVPAPIGWENDSISYRRKRSYLSNIIGKTDAIISANPQMLNYQLSLIDDYKGYSGVLYVSHTALTSNFSSSDLSEIIFLYTGSIYGPRRIDTLMEAFRQFVLEYPLAKLVFVGRYSNNSFSMYQDLIDSGNLEIEGFVSDLTSYYLKATTLIDVNAFFDNDIYLSSKIVNYLPILKPIICITGNNSPARNLFTEDGSILHCHHDVTEILECLRISLTKEVKKQDRQKYVNLLLDSTIVSCFKRQIKDIITK